MIQKFYSVMKSQEYFEKTNTPRIPWKYVLMEAFTMIFSLEIAILMGNILKVHIVFWEGHKILQNFHLTFACMYCRQK